VPLGSAVVARTAGTASEHFGGISGMDFDAAAQRWYLISDDRSQRAPARFYVARIELGAAGISQIDVQAGVALQLRPGEIPDPEALRLDPCSDRIAWASEGAPGQTPSVRLATRDGRHVAELPLPPNLQQRPDAGPRDNLSFEGLAYTPDGQVLWLAMEAPLIEDGPVPTATQGGWARLTRLPRDGGAAQQFAYPLDAIPLPASGGRRRADNGISEILALDAQTLLVVERSGREVADGRFEFDIRLYEARLAGATDVAAIASLAHAGFVGASKRLLLELSRAGLGRIDNIEAAAWGPRLRDGRATLLLASDDNFAPGQVNQFLLFAVEP